MNEFRSQVILWFAFYYTWSRGEGGGQASWLQYAISFSSSAAPAWDEWFTRSCKDYFVHSWHGSPSWVPRSLCTKSGWRKSLICLGVLCYRALWLTCALWNLGSLIFIFLHFKIMSNLVHLEVSPSSSETKTLALQLPFSLSLLELSFYKSSGECKGEG